MTRPIRLLAAACMFLYASCQSRQERAKPVRENITESVYASGIVKSDQQYQVFSNVTGIIKELFVKEGDLVQKGQPILRLADATARLNTENARIAAQFAARSSNLERLQELKMAIEQAAVKCANDSVLLERQKNLWAQQIGSRNDLEQRELAFNLSRANLQAARLRYATLNRQVSQQEQQSDNNWRIASNINDDYTLRSELDGKIYSVLKEKGEIVTPQMPVAVVGDATVFMLHLQVDEFDIAKIRQGLKVLITMDSYKGQVFEARVSDVDPFMDQRTKTFTVKASFVKAPPVLYPNLTCEANIIIQEKMNSLTIPVSYLMDGNYVMLSNKKKRKVSTGMKDYRKVEILGGITANDVIIKPPL